MKHSVSREIGIALDLAIKEYTLENILDVKLKLGEFQGQYAILNDVKAFDLAKYLIEGYEYSRTKEETIEVFVDWLKDFQLHVPYPTKNSSYRRGRRETLAEVEKKLVEFHLLKQDIR